MDFALLGSLAVLALIDSTSFGTLLIPIWLLLHPGRVRVSRMLVFLGTVAAFYFAVGLAIALGADAFMPQLTKLLSTRAASWAQLVIGVALFILSFRLDRKRRKTPAGGGRVARWRERAMNDGGTASLAGLALTAAALEVTTMLPYLAAIGLVTTSALTLPQTALVMAGYCLVMILPALVLMVLRLTAGHRIEPLLTRISNWMANSDALAWIVGIVGFLLARDAVVRLELLG
jgi:hypothetical protein